ncbi:hypothetical protein C8F04DRAFT_1192210 [Mycena alexandri]|uniref:Uncharacterized protein n=1 Tax=Mycena alexandri TaxID=1745969 RepID=A0AAD6SDH5_9AGAR|nr:hypothetical protein C8F04DRAFT_1192210 [Mycena alexandri]
MQLEKLKEAGDKKNDCVMRSRKLPPLTPLAARGRQGGGNKGGTGGGSLPSGPPWCCEKTFFFRWAALWGRQSGRGGHKVTIVRAAEGRQGASQGAAGGVRGAAPGVAGGVITSAGGRQWGRQMFGWRQCSCVTGAALRHIGGATVELRAAERRTRKSSELAQSCFKFWSFKLGDPWNLNGATFTDIQSGRIIFTPPSSFAALDAICGSIDVSTRRERRGSNYMQWQLQFDERHTSFDMSSRYALVLHHRVGSAVAGGTSAPAIRIEHDSKIISSATDLPPIGPWLEARRCSIALRQDILDPDGDDEPPRKRRASGTKKKKPTPPGVRRSTRARRQLNRENLNTTRNA